MSESYVYVISTKSRIGEYKIGFTRQSPNALIVRYNTYILDPKIELLYECGSLQDEKNVHKLLSEFQIKRQDGVSTEWFKSNIKVIADTLHKYFDKPQKEVIILESSKSGRPEQKLWFFTDDEWKLTTAKQIAEITGLSISTIHGPGFKQRYTRLYENDESKPSDIPEETYGPDGKIKVRKGHSRESSQQILKSDIDEIKGMLKDILNRLPQ